jgi:hypothetical protein
MSEEKAANKCICRNSFKTIGKAFQVTTSKLVERMPRKCKAVIKAMGGYFDLFNTFGYYMIPYVFHYFDVFTIILQCRKQ